MLNGAVSSLTEEVAVWFEWGAGTNHEHVTLAHLLASSSSNLNFGHNLTELSGGGTYSFRAVASNSFGLLRGTNQTFVTPALVPANTELPDAFRGAVGWGDYDDDGRLDILLTGFLPTQIWRNAATGFSNINANLPGVTIPIAGWVDFDNDSHLDVGFVGANWRNTGSEFTNVSAGLPVDYISSVSWGDSNGDGRPDILITGFEDNSTRVWWNQGGRFLDSNAELPRFIFSTAVWGDYDNDGRLDFAVSEEMYCYPCGVASQVWRNTGDGFTNVNAGLPGIEFGSLAWGDYDNDGRLDLALSGYTFSNPLTQIWRNTGDGFTNINAGLPGLGEGSVAWGDYDNDGRLDLLLTGRPAYWNGDFTSDVWRNTTNGFVRVNAGFVPTSDGGTAWGDYDNDGRLDVLLTGTTNGGGSWYQRTQLWRNEYPVTNTPPLPPTNLFVAIEGNDAVFRWGLGSDTETPALGLTYNLRVGTTSGGVDLVAPMSLSNGLRQVPRMGNVQQAHQFKLTRVPLNQPIYWSMQSVDTAFAGSPFAPEMSFRINTQTGPPPGPASGDLNGDGTVNQADLSALLATFLTRNPPPIFSVSAPNTNRFQFGVPQLAPLDFTVEASTNLVQWNALGPASLYFDFIDADATNHAARHYQLQLP